MNRKSTYILLFLLLTEITYAQTDTDSKWTGGFALSACSNSMSSVKLNTFNNASFSGFNNQRTWKFQYKMGFSTGFLIKRKFGERLSFQGELNVLLSRQKADLEDLPTATVQPNLFQNIVATQGSVEFNTLYLQIPLIMALHVDEASAIEGGIFINAPLINQNKKDFKITTLAGFDRTLNQFITFPTPKVESNKVQPTMSTNWGWLLGIHYVLNNKTALRLRYEGGMTGVSDFKDLRENRLSIGIVWGSNKK